MREVGALLYGRHWQTDLAEALGVSVRTVRRWARGDAPRLRPATLAAIADLCHARGRELGRVSKALNQSIGRW